MKIVYVDVFLKCNPKRRVDWARGSRASKPHAVVVSLGQRLVVGEDCEGSG